MPEEFPIIAAGVASSGANAQLNPWIALGSCLIGALLGDSLLYTIGYHFGHNLVKAHPRLARLLHAEREAKMEKLINQHGLKVLFLARFMVGDSGGGLSEHWHPADLVQEVPAVRRVLRDGSGELFLFGLSYLFGENVKTWIRDGQKSVYRVSSSGVVLVGLLIFFIRRKRAREVGRAAGVDGAEQSYHSHLGQSSRPRTLGASTAAEINGKRNSQAGFRVVRQPPTARPRCSDRRTTGCRRGDGAAFEGGLRWAKTVDTGF